MSSVLVVVIVGVIIAAITAASISGGPKPATPHEPARRAPEPAPPEPAPVTPPPAVRPPPPPTPPVERWSPPVATWAPPAHLEAPLDTPVAERGPLRRVRAVLLLALAVVVLGSLVAGLLGGAVYLGAHAIRSALG